MSKADLRIQKTLSKLTHAFIELLETDLLTKITINQICTRAKVHRTTFYKHFKDKYDLLQYTCNVLTRPFFDIEFDTRIETPFTSIEQTFTPQMIRVLKVQKEDPLFYDVAMTLFSQSFSDEIHSKRDELIFKEVFPIELFSYIYASTIISMNQWRIHQNLEFNAKDLDDIYQSFMNAKILKQKETDITP
ncbi:TetR/AcrR family transcriptional regulator [Staphylococcus felis]|uniref:TetR/AcrR family transcriptional regulator n=1 Tax=Staphylococcus felis TaxID=46127 RepID=UPI000CD2D11B|nr:TetR/AcrR family transcriptional regulator [Staphylococcus felis]AVP36389.1 TetR/AcrR family transcriptional regulator [Staphylococcus felis]PNZ34347.1 TetR/AcrR family transcriptional regulator [Staphylococcus felis]QQB03639.1 TetR/AcrR family transcriptional regulator [Staphylococcus felis]REI10637.1 TetR/AcrR family transcriptional regulator [Staphylococcus felis]REI14518.1 TetR/AcrR family transcriptional regulator [Staphylococcus felis]